MFVLSADETALNCERFIDGDGLNLFVRCLKVIIHLVEYCLVIAMLPSDQPDTLSTQDQRAILVKAASVVGYTLLKERV